MNSNHFDSWCILNVEESTQVVDEVGHWIGIVEEISDIECKVSGELNRLSQFDSDEAVGILGKDELGGIVGVEVVVATAFWSIEVFLNTWGSIVEISQQNRIDDVVVDICDSDTVGTRVVQFDSDPFAVVTWGCSFLQLKL